MAQGSWGPGGFSNSVTLRILLGDPSRPMDPSSIHRWFKQGLERAGLPTSIKMHELRHSAADNLWRVTGNLMLAQQLLRHESVATTRRICTRRGTTSRPASRL